jgi:hypothetical protein
VRAPQAGGHGQDPPKERVNEYFLTGHVHRTHNPLLRATRYADYWLDSLISRSHESSSQIFSDFHLPFSAPSATLREKIRFMEPNEITAQVVDAAFKIHSQLGPGLLETVVSVELWFGANEGRNHTHRQRAS